MKLKTILIAIGSFIVGIILSIKLFFSRKNDKTADQIKEETKSEIEKMDASDVIADSPNQDAISTTIEHKQSEFRERVRNRLKQKV